MLHQNTVSPSAAEPGCGSTPQANDETGSGLVDMRVWNSLDCNGPILTYPFIVFIKDKISEETTRVLSEILVGIATLQEILSNNSKEFTGKEFQEVLSKRQIKYVITAAYLPQSNRILEQFHRYLGQCIRMNLKYQVVDRQRWVALEGSMSCSAGGVPKATSHQHRRMPLFLTTGQDPTYAINHLLPIVLREMWQQGSTMANLDQLTYIHALAWHNTVLVQLWNKDLTLPWDANVQLGDMVYKQNMRVNKLDPRWLTGY